MLFKNPEIKEKLIENRVKYLFKPEEDINEKELLRGFKISGIHSGFSHFSPSWIKAFIEEFDIKSIYDPCGGWGHRYLGSTSIRYIYNDIDPRSVSGVKKIRKLFNSYCNKKSRALFYNEDAEFFTPKEKYDAVFTCPPYYNKEVYTTKGSASNFDTYQRWLEWTSNMIKSSSENSKKYVAIVMSPDYEQDITNILNNDFSFVKRVELGPIYSNFKSPSTKSKPKDVLLIYSKS